MNQRILASAFLATTILSIATLSAFSQTSIAVNAYGAFNRTTIGNFTQEIPANQVGGLIEFGHFSGPVFGFEVTYSYNRANTTYSTHIPGANQLTYTPALGCPIGYGCSRETVSANAHEFTVDWTPSLPLHISHRSPFYPFGVLGVGFLADVPSSSKATVVTNYPCGIPVNNRVVCPGTPVTTVTTSDTAISLKPVYVYGAGVDWALLSRFGIRFQYRGSVYSAPNMTNLFSATDSYTHTAEPMVGIYFNP